MTTVAAKTDRSDLRLFKESISAVGVRKTVIDGLADVLRSTKTI